LLGDEAWACELTMDELAFVGGGYGSGYGAAPVVLGQTIGGLTYIPLEGYSAFREVPSSNGGPSGLYISVSNSGSAVGYSLVDTNTDKSMNVSKDTRGIIHVADTTFPSTAGGLTPGEASVACHRLQEYLAEAAKKAPGGFGVEIVVNTLVKEIAAFCDHAVDNVDKLYKRSDEAQQVVFHPNSYAQSPTYGYYSNGSGGGSWGSGYGGV
jgi:hypothetical protein